MAKRLRVALIGAGARSIRGYAEHFLGFDPQPEFVAIADPSREYVDRAVEFLNLDRSKVNLYSRWEDLMAAERKLDAAVICTPNHLHHGPAMACIERDMPIVLEKPMAISERDCYEIYEASQRRSVPVQLGFVLRSAPFYRKIRHLLDAGTIGRVVTIQAHEMVSYLVTSIMFRGTWRRNSRYSGGTLLEKCCHDMDVLNWFTGCRPVAVSSFGGQRIFTPNPAVADRCPECGVKDTCQYARDVDKQVDENERAMKKYLNEADACIYNLDHDVNDHQSVQLLYEDGTLCNFMMVFHAAGEAADRQIHIVGTRGRIWGNLNDMKVRSWDNVAAKETVHAITGDGSGHGGGDRTHATTFLRAAMGEEVTPVASPWDGYLSAMVCFAADRSLREGRQTYLRYPATGAIEIE